MTQEQKFRIGDEFNYYYSDITYDLNKNNVTLSIVMPSYEPPGEDLEEIIDQIKKLEKNDPYVYHWEIYSEYFFSFSLNSSIKCNNLIEEIKRKLKPYYLERFKDNILLDWVEIPYNSD